MSSSPPPGTPNFSSSSPARPVNTPLTSERLRIARRDNPAARAYLVTSTNGSGQNMLVVLEEARAWFQLGYEVRDPLTRAFVDIGAVPLAHQGVAFRSQDQAADTAREQLRAAEEQEKKSSNGQANGGCNGINGAKNGHQNGGGAGSGNGAMST